MSNQIDRDLFYKLASELPSERNNAIIDLISNLKQIDNNEEWLYVFKRLINGLLSNKPGARLGFSLCLSEVLNIALENSGLPDHFTNMELFLDYLFDYLNDNSIISKNSTKGKDKRTILFAKLFGLQSLLNDPIFSKTFFTSNNDNLNFNFIIKFLNYLIILSLEKNWFKQSALFIFFKTFIKIKNLLNIDQLYEILILLNKNNLSTSMEGLAIYLSLNDSDINNLNSNSKFTFNNTNWKFNSPLLNDNLSLLKNCLLNDSSTSSSTTTQNNSNTNFTPKLHFVWDILLPILNENSLNNIENKKKQKDNKKIKKIKKNYQFIELPIFWKIIIDESYFNEKSSPERKYYGFLILQNFLNLKNLNLFNLNSLFTKNLINCLINNSKDNNRLLNKISKKILKNLLDLSIDNNNFIEPILKNLLFSEQNNITRIVNFDNLTKTKTINSLLKINNFNDNSILINILNLLSNNLLLINNNKNDIILLLDLIIIFIKSHKLEINDLNDIISPLIKPLIKLLFFKNNENKDLIILDDFTIDKFFSILNELTTILNSHSIQFLTIKILTDLEKSNENKLIIDFDDNLLSIKEKTLSILKNLNYNDENKSKILAFESLLSMSLIQLYLGDQDSLSIIEELLDIYDTKNFNIFEILLSLLCQKKSIFKNLSLLVWQQFIDSIDFDNLLQITDILNTRENKKGFNKIFKGEMDDEDFDDEGEHEDEDDKENDDDENSSQSSDDVSSESSSDDDNDDDENGNSEINKIDREATSALAKALNLPSNIIKENGDVDIELLQASNNNEVKFSSDDDDDSDVSEESMDDEQMLELDDQLSEIFKRRKEALSNVPTGNQRKLDVKESRENVISFKYRMIDLLTIYYKYVDSLFKSDDNIDEKIKHLNWISTILPKLVTCVQETLDRPLAEKVSKLLKQNFFKIKISNLKNDEIQTQIMNTLLEFHDTTILTRKPGQHVNLFYNLCSATSIFFCKLLVANSEETEDNTMDNKLIDLYSNSSKSWVADNKIKLNVHVITDFYNWLNSRRN